jgi:hypothetical protein
LPYQKLGSDKQQQLQILVAKIITDKCWPMKGNSSIDPQFRSYLPGGNTGGSQTSNATSSTLLPNSPTHHTIMADNRQPATMVSNGPKTSKSVILLRNRNKAKLQPSARVVDSGHKSCFPSLERGERKQRSRKSNDLDFTKLIFLSYLIKE